MVAMQKNKNAYPPPIEDNAIGKIKVIIALKNQWEKEPMADPLALMLVGNISDRITQITVPCDAAKNAIKPNKELKTR